jgi:hypothetical protein
MLSKSQPNPWLVASSLIYSIPLYAAIHANIQIATYAFSLLLPASIAYHATRHPVVYYIDQVGVYSVVVGSWFDGYYGGPVPSFYAVLSNVISFYLYFWGKYSGTLIFSSSYSISTASHAMLHAASAIGYTLLIVNSKEV